MFNSFYGGDLEHALLAEHAYDVEPKQEIIVGRDKWEFVPEISKEKDRVYQNGSRIIIAHRGTDPNNRDDLYDDGLILTNEFNANNSKRVNDAQEVTMNALKMFPPPLYTTVHTGHSLGCAVGQISQLVNPVQNLHCYNGVFQHTSVLAEVCKNNPKSEDCVKTRHTYYNRARNDPFSYASRYQIVPFHTAEYDNDTNMWNVTKAHSMDNFIGVVKGRHGIERKVHHKPISRKTARKSLLDQASYFDYFNSPEYKAYRDNKRI